MENQITDSLERLPDETLTQFLERKFKNIPPSQLPNLENNEAVEIHPLKFDNGDKFKTVEDAVQCLKNDFDVFRTENMESLNCIQQNLQNLTSLLTYILPFTLPTQIQIKHENQIEGEVDSESEIESELERELKIETETETEIRKKIKKETEDNFQTETATEKIKFDERDVFHHPTIKTKLSPESKQKKKKNPPRPKLLPRSSIPKTKSDSSNTVLENAMRVVNSKFNVDIAAQTLCEQWQKHEKQTLFKYPLQVFPDGDTSKKSAFEWLLIIPLPQKCKKKEIDKFYEELFKQSETLIYWVCFHYCYSELSHTFNWQPKFLHPHSFVYLKIQSKKEKTPQQIKEYLNNAGSGFGEVHAIVQWE